MWAPPSPDAKQPRLPIRQGLCESCRERDGDSRTVLGMGGSRVLCEECREKCAARIRANKLKRIAKSNPR